MKQESVAFGALVCVCLDRLSFSSSNTKSPLDIEYFKSRSRGAGYFKHQVGNMVFYIRKYKETMKQIDRPKANSALFAHPSERGWKLPRTHKRHFLNFPPGKFPATVGD
jgi:hypothetical protein